MKPFKLEHTLIILASIIGGAMFLTWLGLTVYSWFVPVINW